MILVFKKSKILLFCILFLGLFLRLYGTNWDQGWHLHPDERFLTMVGVDVKIPSTVGQYLDQYSSSFNPVNKGHSFYVYGTFPILLNKVLAQYFYNDTYDQFNLQGRVLSGVADFLVILIIYKLIELVEKKLKFDKSIKYLSAFFYAIAVLPIQLSHFFTVDTFLNFFCWLSLYFAVRLVVSSCHSGDSDVTSEDSRIDSGQARMTYLYYTCLSGLFLGLALACKISAIYFAPLIGMFILFGLVSFRAPTRNLYNIHFWIPIFIGMTTFIFFTYLALRFGSPYYFETGNIFNPQLSTVFINNIQTLKSFENPLALFPPAIQWLSKSYDFSLKNIIFFGVGPVYFLLSLVGAFLVIKKKNIFIILAVFWSLFFLIYQSIQFAKTMRYLIFIYPFLALFAAVGMSYILHRIKKMSIFLRYTLYATYLTMILIWPLAFMSIYTQDHSRVVASKWIFEHIPQNSKITYEYWDDPLPLMVQDPATRNYKGIEIHIFDPDTKEKWHIINDQLKNADYYMMSSNRGWGSISTVPERYPITSKFYKNMFEGKNGFTLIKEFASNPSLRYLGIPIDFPDQWAEESFTVYDHPLVKIFRKQ